MNDNTQQEDEEISNARRVHIAPWGVLGRSLLIHLLYTTLYRAFYMHFVSRSGMAYLSGEHGILGKGSYANMFTTFDSCRRHRLARNSAWIESKSGKGWLGHSRAPVSHQPF
jgi:hypothetical protein